MASQLKVDTITGVTTAGSIAVTGEGNSTTTNLQQGLAKMWANLNGSGTIALRDSLNVGSTTDGGTGIYSFSFTNNFSNDDYSSPSSAGDDSAGTSRFIMAHDGGAATSSYQTRVHFNNGDDSDAENVSTSSLGDLA